MIFDFPKDAVFAEIYNFSNIFGFSVVNWAPNLAKTVNLGWVPFEPKYAKF